MADQFESINAERRLYVLKCGGGYSCLGFTVAFKQAIKVYTWLALNGVHVAPPQAELIGTSAGYSDYARIMDAGFRFHQETKKRCDVDLIPELTGLEGKRVEVVDDDGQTRRFIVGKSTGWCPIHLEIESRRDDGGIGVYGTPFKSVKVIRG